MAVKALRALGLACTLAALAGCNGSPLNVGKSGSAGNGATSSGGNGGSATGTGSAGASGSGGASGLPPCGTILDENACKARLDCHAGHCGNCSGGQLFNVCLGPMEVAPCPEYQCPVVPASCAGLDESTCKLRTDCHPGYCGSCPGPPVFNVCLALTQVALCPALACVGVPAPCTGLDEMACTTRSDCQAEYCNGCQGRAFVGCAAPGTTFACPPEGPACPAVPCASVTDQLSCDARSDCHSVFVDNGACDCATLGCCVGFSRCADGFKAKCGSTGPTCGAPPPLCGEAYPAYVVSYVPIGPGLPNCYEGCVRSSECAP
jgi:hypothetical protein